MIDFERVNLIEPLRGSRMFPIIFCRNVMIYFDEPEQKRLIEKFYHCLNPEGYLFVGHAESLFGLSNKFRMVHLNNATTYQRIEVAS
jgi:chemotaxis protein methyltransferase CheR